MENQKTIQQIAKENDIAPTQVSAWKKELESRMSEIFERKNAHSEAATSFERKSARLERKVGQLVIEKEFLLEQGKRLKCRLLDVYADLWRRRALLMAAGVSSPARFGPYSTRAFIASVR